MKPILILQNQSSDGPAYLARWLAREGVAFDVRDSEAGQACPTDMDAHAGLALLGGEMSANDPLPSLRRAERLIRLAMQAGLPVIGHCLGGQLMARALGARVHASPAPEIGWQPMQVHDAPAARQWLGEPREAVVFHWHAEAFELPAAAQALASSAACPCQAFAVGPHLATQFHLEVDAVKLARWSASRDPDYLAMQARWPSVQSGAAMREQAEHALACQQLLADRVYAQWMRGVVSA